MPKKKTETQKWAAKKKKNTTAKDLPGNGQLKKTANAIEKRKKYLQSL